MHECHGNKAHPYKGRVAVYTPVYAKKERNSPVSALLAQNLSSKQIAQKRESGVQMKSSKIEPQYVPNFV